jgi:hypothetical protein
MLEKLEKKEIGFRTAAAALTLAVLIQAHPQVSTRNQGILTRDEA